MNAPPLIRPLRSLLQGRLQFASARTAQPAAILRPSTQIRTNASISAAPKATKAPQAGSVKAVQRTKPVKPIEIGDHIPEGQLNPSYKGPRMPRALETLYLEPLRREVEYGIPTCDLQLRSYSLPNLDFFCDFALRAAYYLKLPAFGPTPLPRLTKRWTVPRSTFIHKKSQENFERTTLRRLIQIRDGNPETVQIWLAFLQKNAYYGVGMKANVWEFSGLDVAKHMDKSAKELEGVLKDKWELVGQHKNMDERLNSVEGVEDFLAEQRVLAVNGPGGRLD